MWLTCSSAARTTQLFFFTPLRKLVTLLVCYFQSLKITAVGVVRRKGVRNRSGHHINLSSLLNKWIKRAICLADSIPPARTQSAVSHLRSDGFMNLHPELIKQRDSSLTHRPRVCLSLLLIHSFILCGFTSTEYAKGWEEASDGDGEMTWPAMEGI